MAAIKTKPNILNVRIPPGFVARLQKLRDLGWGPDRTAVAINALDEGMKVMERRTRRMIEKGKATNE